MLIYQCDGNETLNAKGNEMLNTAKKLVLLVALALVILAVLPLILTCPVKSCTKSLEDFCWTVLGAYDRQGWFYTRYTCRF